MKIRWARRASTQLLDAISYLEEQRPGSGTQLHEAVREIIGIARERVRLFPRVPGIPTGEVRRALVRRYGYWLILDVHEHRGEIVVLALWHGRRRPGGWQG